MSDFKVIRFAVLVCLGCSVVVSTAALGLRDRQDANLALDIRKNILKSVGLYDATMTPEQVNNLFDSQLEGLVLDAEGNVVPQTFRTTRFTAALPSGRWPAATLPARRGGRGRCSGQPTGALHALRAGPLRGGLPGGGNRP